MYIPKDNPLNNPCTVNVWTFNLMNQPIKIQQMFLKLLSQKMRKRDYKNLGTRVINRPLSPTAKV